MAKIGTLTADLKLQSATFMRDLNRASRAVQTSNAQMQRSMRQVRQATRGVERQFGQLRAAAVGLAGVLAVAQFKNFTKSAIESADAIAKQADRIGLSTKALQEYRLAADLAGVEQSRLDQGVGAFVKRLGELRAGTGALNTLLNKSNVELKNQLVAAQSTEQALQVFLRALSETADQSDRVALSAAAFSRTAGIEMANLVKNGADEVENLRARLSALGLIMEENTLRSAEKLKDEWTLLSTAFKTGFDTAIIEGLTGEVNSSADALQKARRIGEDFGRVVAGGMKAVAVAGRAVAENIRLITAGFAGFVALKAAGFVFGVARAVTALAIALRAAAATAAGFGAVTAGLKKGLVGLAAAGAAIAAYIATAKKVDPAVEDAILAMEKFGRSSADSTAPVGELSETVKDATENMQREAGQAKLLADALRKSETAYEDIATRIAITNRARADGVDLTKDEAAEYLKAATAAQKYAKELEQIREENSKAEQALKDAAEAQKRRAEEQRESFIAPFKAAIDGIDAGFKDMFASVIENGEISFADFGASLKRTFIDLAAEIASLLIFKPVIGGILGAAGLGDLVGAGFGAAGGLTGAAALVPALGVGALSAGAGGGLNDMFGGPIVGNLGFGDIAGAGAGYLLGGTQFAKDAIFEAAALFDATGALGVDLLGGGMLGGSLGGLAAKAFGLGSGNFAIDTGLNLAGTVLGTALGGPIGGAVGGFLGTAAGGLFGGKKTSVGPNGGFNFGNTGGRLAIQGSGGDNGFNPASIRSAADAVVEEFNNFLTATGGTLGSVPYSVLQVFGGQIRSGIGGGNGAPTFGQDAEAAVNNLVLTLIKNADIGGLSDTVRSVIARSPASTLQGLGEDIDFANQIAGMSSSIAPLDKALADVNARFSEMTSRAEALGLSIEELNRTRDREIEATRLAARAPAFSAAENIAAFLRANELSKLSPAERFTAAQRQFGELSAQVRGGDLSATQPLLQTASSLIQLGRQQFASGVSFQTLEQNVRSTLSSLGETVLSDEFFDAQVEATRQQTEVLSEDLQDVRDGIDQLRNDFRQWRLEVAA